jgi:hypothetical protein
MAKLYDRAPWPARYEGGIAFYNNSMTFVRVDGTTTTWNPGFIIIWGGRYSSSFHNDVWATSDSGTTWELLAGTSKPSGGTAVTSGSPNNALSDFARTSDCFDSAGRLYSMTGTRSGTKVSEIWTSPNGGLAWTKLADGPMAPRERATCFTDKFNNVYLAGGVSDNGVLGDLWKSSDFGISWTDISVNQSLWLPRQGSEGNHWFSPTFNKDILFHGLGYSSSVHFNDIWASSDQGASWVVITQSAPFLGRFDTEFRSSTNGILVVSAGDCATNLPGNMNDIWASLDGGYTWGACNLTAGFWPREDHVIMFDKDGYLLLMEGDAPNVATQNDVWRSTTSFFNVSGIATVCGLQIPSCGVGLRCWPGAPVGSPDCPCAPDTPVPSSTGSSQPESNSGSSLSDGAIAGPFYIITFLIYVHSLLILRLFQSCSAIIFILRIHLIVTNRTLYQWLLY